MPFTTVILDGGLDLQTAPVAVTPGRLTDCDNFEVDRAAGYKRVDGNERFDGGPSPSSSDCLALRVRGNPPDSIVGSYATVTGSITDAIVVGVINDKSNSLVLLRPNGPVDFSTSVAGVSSGSALSVNSLPHSAGTAQSWTIQSGPTYPLADGSLTASVWQAMTDRAYLAVRAKVQAVPGKGAVVGLFWMKDALYAARDYVTATATSIASDLVAEDVVTATNFSGKVFSVRRDESGAGTIVFHSAIGSLANGTLKRATSDVATITALTSSPGAGMYKAAGTRGSAPDTQSWTHQNLGYSLRFKNASVDFPSMNRLTGGQPPDSVVQTTPWFVAGGLVAAQIAIVGGVLPDIVQTDDGDTSYASATNQIAYTGAGSTGRPYFKIGTFGIADTDLPDGSAITGLELEVTRRVANAASHTITVTDSRIWFEYAGSPKINVADTQTTWPATFTAATYGSATNLLGCTNLTPALVKADSFTLFFEAYFTPFTVVGTPYSNGRITLVRLRVHYVPPQPSYYVWNAGDGSPSAVVLNIVKSYKDAGSAGSSDAQGTLYVMVDGVPRAITAGEQIRTMPAPGVTPDGGASDGSTLVATVASALTRNLLDGSAALAAADSKYQHVTANFFASADFEAIHGVSGAGPAFLYDGYAFARILTGLPAEKETPRHICVHQSRLFLGYPSGTMQYSAAGDPLDFAGVDGANEVGVASPVTGLYPLNGQTLAIFTRDNVQMMQGDVAAPTMGFATPNTGCIEYTAKSSGIYLYTSNRGVETLGATPAYGDFNNESLSATVGPWLAQRVQRTIRYEGADKSATDALIVRNKQQYRLFFADKKVLTATFLRPEEPPQYTIQTMPVLFGPLLAATESTGRDRLFGATSDGYVYELDRGNRFDDKTITASMTLVVDDQKVAYKKKTFTDAAIHGIGTDYGTFTLSRAADYDTPDPGITYPQVFGSATAAATGQPGYAVSFTQLNLMGRSISFRFDVAAPTEPPITIQAVAYNANPLGDQRT